MSSSRLPNVILIVADRHPDCRATRSASLSVITLAQIGAALPWVDLTGLILPDVSGPETRMQYSRTELVGPVMLTADMPLHRSGNGAITRSAQTRISM